MTSFTIKRLIVQLQLTDIPNNYSPHLWLEDLDDVLTMNTTGQSNYQYFGTNIGSRYSGTGVRYGYANVSSRHTTSADIYLSRWQARDYIFQRPKCPGCCQVC
jgi:hypothetical protein